MKTLKASHVLAALAAVLCFTLACGPGASPEGEPQGSGEGNRPAAEEDIVLGQSCALSGPTAELGLNMRAGLLACFGKVNAGGGIKGRAIRLVTLDDGYEPDRAAANTTKLIEQEKVFALIGAVGTPTSKVALPLAEAAKTPFFAPFTGAELLRGPEHRQVIHVRASYYQEMEALAAYLVDEKKLGRVACFYQDDPYGQSGLDGITRALERRTMQLCATGTYERNTTEVKDGLDKEKAGSPDAVVIVGAYKPAAAFIKQAKAAGMKDTVFCNISFVGARALLAELGDDSEGSIVSQVVVSPWDSSVPLVQEFTADMATYQQGVEPGFVSLEGYMAGKLFCMAAERVEGPLTRDSLMEVIRKTGTFDLGGVTLQYGPEDNEGSDDVHLTVFRGGTIVELE